MSASKTQYPPRPASFAAYMAKSACFSIFYLDLDRFKAVNDGLGHAIDDAVLTAAARRIQNSVRQEDLVARLGGDEFAIIAQELCDRPAAGALANAS